METPSVWSWLGWGSVVALDAFVILMAVARSRNPTATLAWILAVLLFPIGGAVAYVWLGDPRLSRGARRRRINAVALRRGALRRAREASGDTRRWNAEVEGLLSLVSSVTGLLPSERNHVTVAGDEADPFGVIHDMIQGARRTIWTEFYIIRDDETGRKFLEALAAKAATGVEVRVLYDAVGSLGLASPGLAAIRAAGGRVEAFLPITPLRRRWATHLRNHRKVIVVDGEVGLIGSLNVGNEYTGSMGWLHRGKRSSQFRDTHLTVRGPAAADLARTFAEDWTFATEETLTVPLPQPGTGASLVAMVPSGPYEEHNAHGLAYFAGINLARERCYLTSPYFIPDEALIQALVAAALRGVDVRILVPHRSDVWLVMPAARSYYPALLRAGVRVFEYQKSILHAKTMVVDRAWGIVGSANMDIRSFQFNFEMSALVVDPELGTKMEVDFRRDLADSVEVTLEDVQKRSWLVRIGLGAARLFSPIL